MADTRKRRENVAKYMQDGEMLLSFAGNSNLDVSETPDPMKLDPNFLYLTDADINGAILMLLKVQGSLMEFLFVHQNADMEDFYLGKGKTIGEYRTETGIGSVLPLSELNDTINTMISNFCVSKVYFCQNERRIREGLDPAAAFARKLQDSFLGISIGSLSDELKYLRVIKDEEEVNRIRRAIDIADLAYRAVAQNLKPGMKEYQIASIVEHTVKMNGGQVSALLASVGKHAAILHCFDTDETAEEGDLLIVDLCVRVNRYSCDVTRTFPVSGKFTPEQRKWYDICLETQRLVRNGVRPGVPVGQAGEEGNRYLENALRREGYLQEGENIRTLLNEHRDNYATPGMINHGIGLDVHEKRNDPEGMLQPGMVLAIEPGVYFKEHNMGVRVEDDVLVTEDGYELLTAGIPAAADEIEAMMAR
ncbi:MAG: aminopeptidase P family protein [Mogibacterium sp.]|nr:aminopeptidase P family protein [Mogibacterium sp.]